MGSMQNFVLRSNSWMIIIEKCGLSKTQKSIHQSQMDGLTGKTPSVTH